MRSNLGHLGTANRILLLKAAGAAFVAGSVIAVAHHKDRLPPLRLQLNSTLIEAVSGAAGEVAQIAALYPLDTVKVRCQAAGLNSRQVWASLWSSTRGSWAALLSALYAGAVPAAALSILVGSVHYCCFCTTRRALGSLQGGSQSTGATAAGTVAQQQQQQQQHLVVSHGVTGTHFQPHDDAATYDSSSASSSSTTACSHATETSSHQAAAPQQQQQQQQHAIEGSMTVNIAAAVITAAITALVEAPLELFRHNSQAGQIQGNFIKEMWRVLHKSGPHALYFGLIPYCFESWPYDISELLVVGAAKDMRQHKAVRHVQPAAFDLAVGALAGTVAVLVSMPFDAIKTYMQTHGTALGGTGSVGSTGAFLLTGKALVRKNGPGALFVGLCPRLAHQVPGAMVCWWVIETCHRCLSVAARDQQKSRSASAPMHQEQ